MKSVRATSALAGCALAGLLVAGCARGPAAPPQATVQTCTEYGVYAIEHNITVKWQPAACRGLSRSELNFAVGRAIFAVAGSGRGKAAWRARARAAGRRLAHLVTAVPPPTAAPPAQGQATAAPPAAGSGATGIAALVAWLLTVASGGYLLARWARRGGLRRRRGGGLHPGVVLTHFAMATGGLLAWIIYLLTDAGAAAWTAVGLLMPVMGLGIALVTLSAPARFAGVRPAPAAGAPAAGAPATGRLPAARPARRGMPVPVVAGHGVAAALTILLALLAALRAR